MTPQPVGATWTRERRGRWRLTDVQGVQRGAFFSPNWSLRHTRAEVDGQTFEMTARGMFTRRLQVADHTGTVVMTARIGGFLWGGEIVLASGATLSVARKLGLSQRFVIGDPATPFLVMKGRFRQMELTFHPDLPQSAPFVLPVVLLLALLERSSAGPQ